MLKHGEDEYELTIDMYSEDINSLNAALAEFDTDILSTETIEELFEDVQLSGFATIFGETQNGKQYMLSLMD